MEDKLLSIKEIKAIFDETPVAGLESKINEFINDERSGVIKIVESAKKRIIKHENEMKRLDEMLFFEKKYLIGALTKIRVIVTIL